MLEPAPRGALAIVALRRPPRRAARARVHVARRASSPSPSKMTTSIAPPSARAPGGVDELVQRARPAEHAPRAPLAPSPGALLLRGLARRALALHRRPVARASRRTGRRGGSPRAAGPPGTSRASPPTRRSVEGNDHAANARAVGRGWRRSVAEVTIAERPLAPDDERDQVRAVRPVTQRRRPRRPRHALERERPCPRSCRSSPSTARRSARRPSPRRCCTGSTTESGRA